MRILRLTQSLVKVGREINRQKGNQFASAGSRYGELDILSLSLPRIADSNPDSVSDREV
jgi:hypothetical protein